MKVPEYPYVHIPLIQFLEQSSLPSPSSQLFVTWHYSSNPFIHYPFSPSFLNKLHATFRDLHSPYHGKKNIHIYKYILIINWWDACVKSNGRSERASPTNKSCKGRTVIPINVAGPWIQRSIKVKRGGRTTGRPPNPNWLVVSPSPSLVSSSSLPLTINKSNPSLTLLPFVSFVSTTSTPTLYFSRCPDISV